MKTDRIKAKVNGMAQLIWVGMVSLKKDGVVKTAKKVKAFALKTAAGQLTVRTEHFTEDLLMSLIFATNLKNSGLM